MEDIKYRILTLKIGFRNTSDPRVKRGLAIEIEQLRSLLKARQDFL